MGYDKSIICPRRTPCPPGQSLHLHWSATGSWYPSWGELGRVLSGWFPALFKLCTVHFAIIIFNSCGTGGTVLYEAFVSQHHLIGDYNKAWQRIFSPGKTKYIAIYHSLFLYISRLWPFLCLVRTEIDENIWEQLKTGRKIESWTSQSSFAFQSNSFQVRLHVINSALIRCECLLSACMRVKFL